MHKTSLAAVFLFPALCLSANAQQKAELVATYTLPRISLSQFSNPAITEAALKKAKTNGLNYTDLPSVGSGLAKAPGENEFWGINDRGPNGFAGAADDDAPNARRTYPLPQFCPSIFRMKLAGTEIQILQTIPLSDRKGKLITGLSNVKGEEPMFEFGEATERLPFDQDGVDPEAIRVFPNGDFIMSEEYSPSVFIVSPNGRVLMRYTPQSKPLRKATYPVKAILPDVFSQRRINKGFENLALSPDGKFAYVLLQTSMGDTHDARYTESRVIRALKLDVSDPLDAKVVGEYLALSSPASEYSSKQKQEKVSWSDADWIAPEKLLVIERGKGLGKLLLVDFSKATNILVKKDESKLGFEDTTKSLEALNVKPAETHVVFSTADVQGITSDKIEGVVALSPTQVALANDNDFGIGDNTTGEPSRVWIINLAEPLPLAK